MAEHPAGVGTAKLQKQFAYKLETINCYHFPTKLALEQPAAMQTTPNTAIPLNCVENRFPRLGRSCRYCRVIHLMAQVIIRQCPWNLRPGCSSPRSLWKTCVGPFDSPKIRKISTEAAQRLKTHVSPRRHDARCTMTHDSSTTTHDESTMTHDGCMMTHDEKHQSTMKHDGTQWSTMEHDGARRSTMKHDEAR